MWVAHTYRDAPWWRIVDDVNDTQGAKLKPNAVQVETKDGTLWVKSPYNPEFVRNARTLGGKWSPPTAKWQFDPRTEERLRTILKSVYGTDQEEYPGVTVKLDAKLWYPEDLVGNAADCYFAGRLILSRKSRDGRVILGEGVILTDGAFPSSGGSVRNPRLSLEESAGNIFLEIYDVPADHLDLHSESKAVTIISRDPGPKPEGIRELTIKAPSGHCASRIPAEDMSQALRLALALDHSRIALLIANVNIQSIDKDRITLTTGGPGRIQVSVLGSQVVISVELDEPPEWMIGFGSGEIDPLDVPILTLSRDDAEALLGELA